MRSRACCFVFLPDRFPRLRRVRGACRVFPLWKGRVKDRRGGRAPGPRRPGHAPTHPPLGPGGSGGRGEAPQVGAVVCPPPRGRLGRLAAAGVPATCPPTAPFEVHSPQEGPAWEDSAHCTRRSSLGTVPPRMCLQGGSSLKHCIFDRCRSPVPFFLPPSGVCGQGGPAEAPSSGEGRGRSRNHPV